MSELKRLYEAARVYERMAPDLPKDSASGKWRLRAFEIDAQQETVNRLRASIQGAKHGGIGTDHFVPEGNYVKLERLATDYEVDGLMVAMRESYIPVMSDTPNEMQDATEVLRYGTGRVLVHGLGLGCVIAGLLAKPDVTHIDVVEIDPEVIDLTASYYRTNGKVAFHEGDCLTYPWPDDVTWDYAWHDIWSQISTANLDDDEAEHGVSYGALFRRFRHRVRKQGAWSYTKALMMQRQDGIEEALAEEFCRRWRTWTPEERYQELLQRQFNHPILGGEAPPPDKVEELMAMAAPDHLKMLRRASENPDLKPIQALMILNLID